MPRSLVARETAGPRGTRRVATLAAALSMAVVGLAHAAPAGATSQGGSVSVNGAYKVAYGLSSGGGCSFSKEGDSYLFTLRTTSGSNRYAVQIQQQGTAVPAGETNLATSRVVLVTFVVRPHSQGWTSGWSWLSAASQTRTHLGSGSVRFSKGGTLGSLSTRMLPKVGTHGDIKVKASWNRCRAIS